MPIASSTQFWQGKNLDIIKSSLEDKIAPIENQWVQVFVSLSSFS